MRGLAPAFLSSVPIRDSNPQSTILIHIPVFSLDAPRRSVVAAARDGDPRDSPQRARRLGTVPSRLRAAAAAPAINLDNYPAVSRAPIARALDAAKAHPDDADRVGELGMMLQAWEQFETAAAVYARARALAPRFEWFYLGGLVETRLAHHREAAQLLAEAVRISPSSLPARLALADALFESGDVDGARRQYEALTSGASEPHARYGLGRSSRPRATTNAALGELDAAVRLFPEFGAAWYARGMVLRRLGRIDDARDVAGEGAAVRHAVARGRGSDRCARARAARRRRSPFRSRVRVSAARRHGKGDRGIRGRGRRRPEVGTRPRQPDRALRRRAAMGQGRTALSGPGRSRPARCRGTLQLRRLSRRAGRDRQGGRRIPDGARDQSAVRAGVGRPGTARRERAAASTRPRPPIARRPSRRQTMRRRSSISRA